MQWLLQSLYHEGWVTRPGFQAKADLCGDSQIHISGRPQLSNMLITFLTLLYQFLCVGGGAGHDSFILKGLVMNLIQARIVYIRKTLGNSFTEEDKNKPLLSKAIFTIHSLTRSCDLLVDCRQSPHTVGSFCGQYYPWLLL